jgi:NADPH-dependent 2,4-dienoyl-CoA reductase/sulfur reductase-like enzyme
MAERGPRIVILGAGPAGVAAAAALVDEGHRPMVIDEAQAPGGQAFRRPSASVTLDAKRFLGSQAAKFTKLHASFAGLLGRIDYRPGTLAWNVFDRAVHTVRGSVAEAHDFDALILAAGATDRLLPVPGWTLPGVYSLGGAQTLLKDQGCAIGRAVVFCGSSPLLYLAGLQYSLAGAHVVAILDTTPLRRKAMAVPKLASVPGTLLRGLWQMAALRKRGAKMYHGVRLLQIEGDGSVEGLRFRDSAGTEHRLGADAVALGFGLRAEAQLAELAGARLRYDPAFRQFLPEIDEDGRCGSGIYAAGDGCAIGGADAAGLSGRLAAYAVIKDFGESAPLAEMARLRRRVRRLRRFQLGLATAFAWPFEWLFDTADEVILCRCENVTLGEVRRVMRSDLPPADVNRAKAFTRCGMGRCQGRFCGLSLAELMAAESRRPLEQMGWLRVQAPVKPIPLTAAAAAAE